VPEPERRIFIQLNTTFAGFCPKRKQSDKGIVKRGIDKAFNLPRQQPFNTLRRLPGDPKQDLGPDLHVAVFHRGEIVADANTFDELLTVALYSLSSPAMCAKRLSAKPSGVTRF
jgi:hypothetical protein